MTKADLADVVYRIHGGLSRREAGEVVEKLIDAMKQVLLSGGRVQVSGFGQLEIVSRRARKGRNPRTGEVIAIESRRALVFRPSKTLIQTINQ